MVASSLTLTRPQLVRAELAAFLALPTARSEAEVVYSDVSVFARSYSGLYHKPVVSLVVSVQPDVSLQPDVGVLTRGVLCSPKVLSVPDTKDKTRSVLTTTV